MKITRIEENGGRIEKGKAFNSPVYYTSAIITLEDGSKTTYTIRANRLRDLKATLARLPFDVQGAELNNGMISISFGSNLL